MNGTESSLVIARQSFTDSRFIDAPHTYGGWCDPKFPRSARQILESPHQGTLGLLRQLLIRLLANRRRTLTIMQHHPISHHQYCLSQTCTAHNNPCHNIATPPDLSLRVDPAQHTHTNSALHPDRAGRLRYIAQEMGHNRGASFTRHQFRPQPTAPESEGANSQWLQSGC